MVSFTTINGTIQFEDPAATLRMLESELTIRLAAEAEQAQLSKVYSTTTLAKRLVISVRSVGDLIREGRIRYTCCGAKNYRISELAVRQFLADIPA